MRNERRKGSVRGKQDCGPILKMDPFQWRLKSCVRCSLGHLGRDPPSYREKGKGECDQAKKGKDQTFSQVKSILMDLQSHNLVFEVH